MNSNVETDKESVIANTNSKAMNIDLTSLSSVKVKMKLEDYKRNIKEVSVELKDQEIINKIIDELSNKQLKDYTGLKLDFIEIFTVDLGNGISFVFDNNETNDISSALDKSEEEYIRLNNNGKSIITAVDKKLLFEISDYSYDEYEKTLTIYDKFKSDKLEIYTINENYAMYNEETNEEKINELLEACNSLQFESLDEDVQEPELVKSASYKIDLGTSTFYIDKNFENGILDSIFGKGDEAVRYHKVINVDLLKKFIPQSNVDEKFKVIEANMENNIGEDTELNIYVKDGSLSAQGINLRNYIANFDGQAERYKNNDFIIYKDNSGSWEELPSFAQVDKNIVTKTGDTEVIDWTEKYGTLEPGVYKLERSLFFGDTRGSIEGEVENKYYVIFEIK